MKSRNPIPVLMYHSVGRKINDWKWSYLTVPVQIFENQLKWLSKKKYKSVNLSELYAHVQGRTPLPKFTLVITFDDGYLDNWTYAYPLLEQYGFSATVFINPEFVDKCDVVRPNLKDVWLKRAKKTDLQARGFMSWSELKIANESKILSVQSHSLSHTWYTINNEVIDFHHPGDGYYWLDWNNDKNSKPYYLKNPQRSYIPWGVPIYTNGKALECKRFYPDEREGKELSLFVSKNGGEDFFKRKKWKNILQKRLENYRATYPIIEKYESIDERKKRIIKEISESKKIIELKLDCKIEHFAFPGGGYDDYAMEQALKIYKSVTLSSRNRDNVKNRIGEDPNTIKRIGVPYIENSGEIIYLGGRYLIKYLEEFKGSFLSRKQRQALKIFSIVGQYIKKFYKKIIKLGT